MKRHTQFALVLATAFSAIAANSLCAQESGVKALKEREKRVIAVVRQTMPATVAIEGTELPASGSGVIVSKDGLILTAAHVTAAAGQTLRVTFPDGRSVRAKSLGANSSRDAGMAQITEEGEWPYVEMAKPEEVTLGDWCVALGHPGGYDPNRTPPVRIGRVWIKGQMGMLGSDCTLVGGDSGGPLFNLDGKLIGIHSSIGGQLSENRHVPMDAYKDDWDDLVGGKLWGSQAVMTGQIDPDRPALGVQLDRRSSNGVTVSGLSDPSPAGEAGIEVGDIIREVAGNKIRNYGEMVEALENLKAGQRVKIGVRRGEENFQYEVKLGRLGNLWNLDHPPGSAEEEESVEARPSLGVQLVREADGAEVYEVVPGSAADTAGILAGDRILTIDEKEIASAAQMAEDIGSREPGDQIRIKLQRGEEEKELEIILGEAP